MIVVLLEEIQYLYRYAGKAGGVYAEPRKSRVAILVCRRRAISCNPSFVFFAISVDPVLVAKVTRRGFQL